MQLTWGVGEHRFRVDANDSEAQALLSEILGPWRIEDHSPYLGHWVLEPSGGRWSARRMDGEQTHHGSLAEVVTSLEYNAVVQLHANPSLLLLHGSMLWREQHCLLILGAPEAGKSTFSWALARAGWQLLTDDCIVVEPGSNAAAPGPRRLSLRDGAHPLLGEDEWLRLSQLPGSQRSAKGLLVHPQAFNGSSFDRRSRPVTHVILLDPARSDPGPQVVNPAQSVLRLLAYSNYLKHHSLGLAIPAILPLAEKVVTVEMGRQSLSTMVGSLEDLISSG